MEQSSFDKKARLSISVRNGGRRKITFTINSKDLHTNLSTIIEHHKHKKT